jgi:hypothetical protein
MAEPPSGPAAADPSAEVDGRSRRRMVREALSGLPIGYRRAVFLHHFAGMTYDEIAAHEGTSTAAVRTRLMRARRLLRVRIEELATARGEWPLPAAAPVAWMRDRVAGARVVADRVDGALGQHIGTAAQYAAALLFAVGIGIGGGDVADADLSGPRAAPAVKAAGADAARVAVGSPALTHAVPNEAQRVADGIPPVPPVVRNYTYVVTPKKVNASQTVVGQQIPAYAEFAFQCTGGTNEPGPVTKLVCATFPNGVTP